MIDLEERLGVGPLAVRTRWSSEETAWLARQVLLRRRRRFFVRGAVSAMSCVVLVSLAFWATASSPSADILQFGKLELAAKLRHMLAGP
jgi:hypothetical protein